MHLHRWAHGVADIFVRDTVSNATTRVSVSSGGAQGYHPADYPSISADGRFVTFSSAASNLVAGDGNGTWDIFVHEMNIPPTVTFGAGSIPPSDGANLTVAPSQLVVRFSENVLGDGSQHAANSLQNYMLLRPGVNGAFDTLVTSAAIYDAAHTPTGDDERIGISGITYAAASFKATQLHLISLPLWTSAIKAFARRVSSSKSLTSNNF